MYLALPHSSSATSSRTVTRCYVTATTTVEITVYAVYPLRLSTRVHRLYSSTHILSVNPHTFTAMSHPTASSTPRPSNNWNQKTLDANSKITEEINTARELQQNMRPQMKAIVGIPYLSGAIGFNGDLAEWVEKNTSPNDQENSFLKVNARTTERERR